MPTRARPSGPSVPELLEELRALATPRTLAAMGRLGVPTERALGVPVVGLQSVARRIGRDHALADALWDTGTHDARMLAALVDDPAQVDRAQMDRWLVDAGCWPLADTVAFHLFDRTAHALDGVDAWTRRPELLHKRAGLVLLAAVAVHGRAGDDELAARLPVVERCADDGRDLVEKAATWALRELVGRIGVRTRARAIVDRLASSQVAAERRVGLAVRGRLPAE